MARSVAGIFPDRQAAESAVIELKQAGFDPGRIGVLLRDREEARALATDQGTESTEGAVAGSIVGGSLGAILVAVGALAIPGVGPFISGGVLAALVGGAAGWLVGGLAGLGIPKAEAEYYETQVQQGRALVTVDAQGRDIEARAILLRNGAEDLKGRGFDGGYESDAMTLPAGTGATTGAALSPAEVMPGTGPYPTTEGGIRALATMGDMAMTDTRDSNLSTDAGSDLGTTSPVGQPTTAGMPPAGVGQAVSAGSKAAASTLRTAATGSNSTPDAALAGGARAGEPSIPGGSGTMPSTSPISGHGKSASAAGSSTRDTADGTPVATGTGIPDDSGLRSGSTSDPYQVKGVARGFGGVVDKTSDTDEQVAQDVTDGVPNRADR